MARTRPASSRVGMSADRRPRPPAHARPRIGGMKKALKILLVIAVVGLVAKLVIDNA